MNRKRRENLKKMILKSKINPLLKTHKNKLQIKINNSNTISRKIKEDNNKTIININNKLPIRKTTTRISIEQLIMSSKESSQLKAVWKLCQITVASEDLLIITMYLLQTMFMFLILKFDASV